MNNNKYVIPTLLGLLFCIAFSIGFRGHTANVRSMAAMRDTWYVSVTMKEGFALRIVSISNNTAVSAAQAEEIPWRDDFWSQEDDISPEQAVTTRTMRISAKRGDRIVISGMTWELYNDTSGTTRSGIGPSLFESAATGCATPIGEIRIGTAAPGEPYSLTADESGADCVCRLSDSPAGICTIK